MRELTREERKMLKKHKKWMRGEGDERADFSNSDLHYLGTNFCCCGDRLIKKSTSFNNTTLIKKYGLRWTKEQVDKELVLSNCCDCKCNNLFTSNRQEGCVNVQDFFDKRFYRKSSPFSPEFQYVRS